MNEHRLATILSLIITIIGLCALAIVFVRILSTLALLP